MRLMILFFFLFHKIIKRYLRGESIGIKKIQKKKNIDYIYSEELKIEDEYVTEEELKKIFNYKYFKIIMKIEKVRFEDLKLNGQSIEEQYKQLSLF